MRCYMCSLNIVLVTYGVDVLGTNFDADLGLGIGVDF